MKYWILSLLTLLTSNYLHANDNNVIEIVLIQDDFDTWLDKGKTYFNWNNVLNKTPENAVKIEQIKKDYEENQVFFNKKYSNKWFRLKGTVDSVKMENNEIYINLNGQYSIFRAYTEAIDYASSLKKNQEVDLYCFNVIPYTKQYIPFIASKCIPYSNHILEGNTKKYLNEIQSSKEYERIKAYSEVLHEIIPQNEIKQNCTSIETKSKCMKIINEYSNSSKFEQYLKQLNKECKKNEKESCKYLIIKDL